MTILEEWNASSRCTIIQNAIREKRAKAELEDRGEALKDARYRAFWRVFLTDEEIMNYRKLGEDDGFRSEKFGYIVDRLVAESRNY